jgi:glycine cleavage system transcriptional repressor
MPPREFLILSATERDRPGLVAELSGFIAQHGCNVEDSRVVVLGGYAGLMFLVSGSSAQVEALQGQLGALERTTGFRVVARRIAQRAPEPSMAPAPAMYVVVASAMDHEGIIHAITDTVRAHGGNIVEMETTTESAPMSGSPLLAMRMAVSIAERHGSAAQLRAALDAVARAEAIDLELQPADEPGVPGAGTLRPV